jgi:hypothetical protein
MHPQSKIFEGLEQSDLKRLIHPELHIDEFKSKMGTDSDIIVLSFKVHDKQPANDLMMFLESGYNFVLDADVSAGVMDDGDYIVFAEIKRSTSAPEEILQLIDDILNLTDQDITDWKFQYRKNSQEYDLTIDNISKIVPLNPKIYSSRYKDHDEEITAMQEAARVTIHKTAPINSWTEQLRVAAGLK